MLHTRLLITLLKTCDVNEATTYKAKADMLWPQTKAKA